MEEKGRETIETFDSLMTTNRIQMMKVVLSWLPPRQQGGLAIYIKFAEFQYAMQYFSRHQDTPLLFNHKPLPLDKLINGSLLQEDSGDVVEFLRELLPFSGSPERARIESIINMLNSISKMKEMMEMMEMMKELFPEGMGMDMMNMGMGDPGQTSPPGDDSRNDSSETAGSGDSTPVAPSPLDLFSSMTGMSGTDLSALLNLFGTDHP